MTDPARAKPGETPLNPDLRETRETTHDTGPSKAPLDSTGAHEGSQGEGWPIVWAVVTIVSIVLAVYYLV